MGKSIRPCFNMDRDFCIAGPDLVFQDLLDLLSGLRWRELDLPALKVVFAGIHKVQAILQPALKGPHGVENAFVVDDRHNGVVVIKRLEEQVDELADVVDVVKHFSRGMGENNVGVDLLLVFVELMRRRDVVQRHQNAFFFVENYLLRADAKLFWLLEYWL